MPINGLYHTWFQRIRKLRPNKRITEIRSCVWLIIGIYQSRSVCLSRIAGKIPGPAKLVSATLRLSRLLNNSAIQVRERYEPISREWLETQFRHMGEIRLIGDSTKIGFDLQRTMLCHFKCLSRLTLAVALLYIWLVSIGTRTTCDVLRRLMDSTESCDLSIFQIGLRFVGRCVINALTFRNTIRFIMVACLLHPGIKADCKRLPKRLTNLRILTDI